MKDWGLVTLVWSGGPDAGYAQKIKYIV